MFGFFRRLVTGEQDEVTEIFKPAQITITKDENGEINVSIPAAEVPTVRTADTSEAAFTPVVTNPLDWESQPVEAVATQE